MIPPIAIPDGGCECPGGIETAAAVRSEGEAQRGDAEAESDGHRVGVIRIPRVPDSACEKHEYSRGQNLGQNPVGNRQTAINVRHAERPGLRGITAV